MQTVRSASSILKGHRSIANHVRYSDRNKLLVSCGVEKLIKVRGNRGNFEMTRYDVKT